MHPEVEMMVELAAPVPTRGPDMPTILAGGRRLKRVRRVRRGATAVALVAALGFAVPAVIESLGTRAGPLGRIQPAAPRENTEPFRESAPLEGPAYVDRVRGEDAYLVGEKEVVASGVVLGEPWSMVELVTTENSQAELLCVEFMLGQDGNLGGSGNCATPKIAGNDSLVTLGGQYWGDAPEIVAVVGSLQEPAVSATVELEDGRTRALDIFPSVKNDKIRWYVFFPPPFERGRVVAFNAKGEEVGSRTICFPLDPPDGEERMRPLPRGQNAGCSE